LVARGANGVLVTSQTGRPIGVEAEQFTQLLNALSEGLDRHDAQLANSATDKWPGDFLESVTRGLYADTKPTAWTVETGYRDDGAATVIANGRFKSGMTERHVVTFVLRDNTWLIRRTYWDESNRFSF
jgi:hypothetical protein